MMSTWRRAPPFSGCFNRGLHRCEIWILYSMVSLRSGLGVMETISHRFAISTS